MSIPLQMAGDTELKNIGISAPSPESLPEKMLAETDRMLNFSRSLKVMLETCTKCGACANACHSYLGTNDTGNIPTNRADLLRRIYKKNFTIIGKLLSRIQKQPSFSPEEAALWIDYAYQCNLCRRCSYYCPFGIDTAEIAAAMRYILGKVGYVSRFQAGIIANLLQFGNNSGTPQAAIIDTCDFLEQDLKEQTGLDIKIPVDKPQADVLYIPSSTEFLHNVETLLGAAKIFHLLGLNWTISSRATEAANYGIFINPDLLKFHNKRFFDAAGEAGASLVVMGECGHAWRVAKMFSEAANGPVPFKVIHILELVAQNLEKLPLRKAKMRVTLHDPCNYARSGDITEAPRRILRTCVTDFVEMSPNKEMNYCCGGGSGLLMEEMMEVRMKLAQKKAEQLQALGKLDALIAPCASCKAQFPHVVKHYGLDIGKISGIMALLNETIQL